MVFAGVESTKRRLSARLQARQMPLQEKDINRPSNGSSLPGVKNPASSVQNQLKRRIPIVENGTSQRRAYATAASKSITNIHQPRAGSQKRAEENYNTRTSAVNNAMESQQKPAGTHDNSNGPPKKKKRAAWDTKGRLEDMEQAYSFLQSKVKSSDDTVATMRSMIEAEQAKLRSLESFRADLESKVESKELENKEIHSKYSELQREMIAIERKHADEINLLKQRHAQEISQLDSVKQTLKREVESISSDLQLKKDELEAQKSENSKMRASISTQSTELLTLESDLRALRLKHERSETTVVSREATIGELREHLDRANEKIRNLESKIREEETLRRKLHNTIQELKGNIRVFCRLRPVLGSEAELQGGCARLHFPGTDMREIELSESTSGSLGNLIDKSYPFQFDKIFRSDATQEQVFDEISQLVQSALDGYNVCIFAYGQTGSGKTYTMEGPLNSTPDQVGMIPRAVHQIYDVAEKLKSKGWEYTMEGQFLEIYNETIHDLLGSGDQDKKKHEIRHEKSGNTVVTDMTTVILDSPAKVNALLKTASRNRSVGATNVNERSSRSHSVFTLKLQGHNAATGEDSFGVLNLIDLAGSERLSMSGSTGDRLKETQAINRSLSCLGDVIYALGNAKEGSHIPYRNSKLTYLLQNSLGGNSKTLMFVNISPLMIHFQESLCSLRFATKVNNTQIGTAKRLGSR